MQDRSVVFISIYLLVQLVLLVFEVLFVEFQAYVASIFLLHYSLSQIV